MSENEKKISPAAALSDDALNDVAGGAGLAVKKAAAANNVDSAVVNAVEYDAAMEAVNVVNAVGGTGIDTTNVKLKQETRYPF